MTVCNQRWVVKSVLQCPADHRVHLLSICTLGIQKQIVVARLSLGQYLLHPLLAKHFKGAVFDLASLIKGEACKLNVLVGLMDLRGNTLKFH